MWNKRKDAAKRRVPTIATMLLRSLCLILALFPIQAYAFSVPPNDGFVTQTSQILTPQQKTQIEQALESYERETSNEIAILIVESLSGESIADVANSVFRTWGIGKAAKNNGILILVSAADHEVDIEVGYGLEGAVPDIVAKGVIEEDMIPHFRDAQYAEGLLAGVDALRKHIGGEYTAERYVAQEGPPFASFLILAFFIVLNIFGAIMARTKSWWLGGVLGGVLGLVLAFLFAWWLAIPFFVGFGLLIDFLLSRTGSVGRRGVWFGGGRWGGGMGGGGGFGGFGGGMSGGGGARGRW